ncbi:hypothetical protein DFJ74DRAFT_707501 [Hyaloraphidium curvatum]|nr:hypothetical protein DFJ74DRAFT_707501 [Hyaloraphidium curvatum]
MDPNAFPEIRDPAHFDADFAAINGSADGAPVVCWFFGSEMEANEQSWCLECVTADPWIVSAYREAVLEGHRVVLVQARVGTKEESVPCLLKFEDGQAVAKLDRYVHLTDLDALKRFFTSK